MVDRPATGGGTVVGTAAVPSAIDLSLVSHTNVGKTTLARTLLRRDVGEVEDRPHVTELSQAHVLIDTPQGDLLRLWDTPGFGDSARLLRRLRTAGNPLGWFLTQVWDRLTDRPFYSSQQALKNARDESDVVLYLVNAAEDPASAGYVEVEMQILGWIGKPVLLLLNQAGPPRGPAADAAEEAAWKAHLATYPWVSAALGLDAFARCWVQEDQLLVAVQNLLPGDKRGAFDRLLDAWRRRNLDLFDAAMHALAAQLAGAATDRETLGPLRLRDRTSRWLAAVMRGGEPADPDRERAMTALAMRLDQAVREGTDRLIALHGLSGRAAEQILARVAGQFDLSRAADVGKSGVIGGLVSGALGGLVADLHAGGLTFGAGALIGSILGALGAGGAAQAYNHARGSEGGRISWSAPFLNQRFAAALLRYLAVAHFGRGRGEWVESEYPAHWQPLVEEAARRRRTGLDAVWARAAQSAAAGEIEQALQPIVAAATREVLLQLYPAATGIFATEQPPPSETGAAMRTRAGREGLA
jgi:hypothetical protein